jgi:D-3-phosphoglycerate dehydrogenase
MSKPELLYYEVLDFQPDTLEYINKFFNVITLRDPNSDSDEILKRVKALFAPMGFLFDKCKIDKCENLQLIGSPTTGTHHIDVEYANKRNISVCSLKNQQRFLSKITPTAELAWGLVLAVTRQIPQAHDSVCEGNWNGRILGEQTPRMLSAMTLGIIGLGRLGSIVAGYGKAFNMKVFYYDPYINDDRHIRCETLHELAKLSDIVSIHAHLTKETESLVDSEFIHNMPKGSFIINTARGGIVDEDDLLNALKSGYLAGAGLDMLEGEHLPGFKERLSEHPLIKYAKNHDNLVITPKIGGCTIDAWGKTERHIVDLIIEELK